MHEIEQDLSNINSQETGDTSLTNEYMTYKTEILEKANSLEKRAVEQDMQIEDVEFRKLRRVSYY